MANTDLATEAQIKALETGVNARLRKNQLDAPDGVPKLDSTGKLAASKLNVRPHVTSLLGAADAAASRSAIGAGTSDVQVGTAAGNAADAAAVDAALGSKLSVPTGGQVTAGYVHYDPATKTVTTSTPAGGGGGTTTVSSFEHVADPYQGSSTIATLSDLTISPGILGDVDTFPVGEWYLNVYDTTSANNVRQTVNFGMGVNNVDVARANGFQVITPITASKFNGTVGSETIARSADDELDMGTPGTGPGSIATFNSEISQIPNGVARAANFSKGVAKLGWLTDPQALAFTDPLDVYSIDGYMYSDRDWSAGAWPQCQSFGITPGETARRAASYYVFFKSAVQRCSTRKPVLAIVEVASPTGVNAAPLPEQVEGAAWATILAGCEGVLWFYQTNWMPDLASLHAYNAAATYAWDTCNGVTHNGKRWGLRPQITTVTGVQPGLTDATSVATWAEITQNWVGSTACPADMKKKLQTLRWRWNTMARALRGDRPAYTPPSGLNAVVVTDGVHTWLIAQPSHAWTGSGTTYTIPIPAGYSPATVQVMWESRAITPVNGAISDKFAKEYTTHVYQIA